MKRLLSLFLVVLLGGLLAWPALAQSDSTRVQTVSYAELGKLVRANKGKVLVVYFWAEF